MSCGHDHSHDRNIETPTLKSTAAVPSNDCFNRNKLKYVRVNIHYILRSDGTGNFRPNDDGWGNSNFTGYDFAEDIIIESNRQLAQNNQMWLPANNSTPIFKKNIQLVLTGVYFHASSIYDSLGSQFPPTLFPHKPDSTNWNHYTNFGSLTNYQVNSTTEFNVFYIVENDFPDKQYMGIASLSTNNVKLQNAWHQYHTNGMAYKHIEARLLLHELAHVWGLRHSWEAQGSRDGDFCDDTPVNNNCWMQAAGNPRCNWGLVTNNLMDYSAYDNWALTTCQGNIVHSNLETSLSAYLFACRDTPFCVPAYPNFTLPSYICAKNANFAVVIDGRATFNETYHHLEIFEVSQIGVPTPVAGTSYSQWFTGEIGQVNLRTYCNYNFQVNKKYYIKLAVATTNPIGQICSLFDQTAKYVEILPVGSCPVSPEID